LRKGEIHELIRPARDGQGWDKVAGDPKQIIDEIKSYISEGGGEYGDWYVGMADNPIDPVTEVLLLHKVQSHRFTYIETISPRVAKEVADYFVNVAGTDGSLSEEEKSGAYRALYVYKKAAHPVG